MMDYKKSYTEKAKQVINDIETWKMSPPNPDCDESWNSYKEGWNEASDAAIQFIKKRFDIEIEDMNGGNGVKSDADSD